MNDIVDQLNDFVDRLQELASKLAAQGNKSGSKNIIAKTSKLGQMITKLEAKDLSDLGEEAEQLANNFASSAAKLDQQINDIQQDLVNAGKVISVLGALDQVIQNIGKIC